jgi:hypothetical protein
MSSFLDPDGYRYHHGTGQHYIVQPDPDENRPKYSMHCFLCTFVDFLCFLLVVGFFIVVYWILTYLYSDGG